MWRNSSSTDSSQRQQFVQVNRSFTDEDALLTQELPPKPQTKPVKPFVPTSGPHGPCRKSIEDLYRQLADSNKRVGELETQMKDLKKANDALTNEIALLRWATPSDDVVSWS